MEAIASRAFDSVRAPRYMREGRCFASWRIVSLPRPALPVIQFVSGLTRECQRWLTPGHENNLPSEIDHVTLRLKGGTQ